ncbi:MAG: M20/M25/M40 family metallo-hydrolase [bacterium]|nr:M20/M25/M40 family metallo-hydrolase [bacterium]
MIRSNRDLGLHQAWQDIDYTQYESVQIFQEYLRIDTSYPHGNEIPGAEFLARQLAKAGIDSHLERLGDRNANLWAILEGEDPRALVLHNHIDVDPIVDPVRWLHPPFGGVLDPPFIFGRGAFDMKSIAIAQLLAVKELKQSGQPLKRSVIFLATGDEERDSRLGSRWLIRRHPELVERFGALLTEGGAVEALSIDEVKYWGTEFQQKRFIDVWVCAAHRAPLEALRADLTSPEYPKGRRQLSPEITRFFKIYAETRQHPDFRRFLRRPELFLKTPEFDALSLKLQVMMSNGLVAFPVEEDPEGGYTMRVILHLLPWVELDEAWEELLPWGLSGFSYTVDVPHGVTAASPLDHPVYQGIHEYLGEAFPDTTHGPLFLPTVATDARFFRAAGISSYGFSPFLVVSTDSAKISGPNERIAAPAFVAGVDLYRDLVRHLVH